jgi:hypothetical protein
MPKVNYKKLSTPDLERMAYMFGSLNLEVYAELKSRAGEPKVSPKVLRYQTLYNRKWSRGKVHGD